MASIVRAQNVTKRFTSVLAVDRLDLHIEPGEIFALLGPNGAGKTTFVRMLVGINAPDEGSIVLGPDPDGLPLDRRAIGYLPEDRGLVRDVPVLRSLEFFGLLHGLSRTQARARGQAWLERLDLADRGQDKLETLSKGNQQKVQFVCAVLHEPVLAVLDEPFSGLDPVNQQLFLEVLRELRDAGTTILLSAHQMDLVEQVADRIVLLDRGREVLSGTLEELRRRSGTSGRLVVRLREDASAEGLRSHPAVLRVEPDGDRGWALWLTPDASLASLLEMLGRDFVVEAIESRPPHLREIFLAAVAPPSDVSVGELRR